MCDQCSSEFGARAPRILLPDRTGRGIQGRARTIPKSTCFAADIQRKENQEGLPHRLPSRRVRSRRSESRKTNFASRPRTSTNVFKADESSSGLNPELQL